jgi:antitoxin component YwqK of YwqJK toxin-antitoxin module
MKEYKVKVTDSKTEWYNLNGQLHREDGPAIEYAVGTKYWYINGQLHREDGPAIEWAYGTKEWFINGKLHREDGPAVENANGAKHWYINGKLLTETEFNQRTQSCIGKIVEIDGKKYKLTQI